MAMTDFDAQTQALVEHVRSLTSAAEPPRQMQPKAEVWLQASQEAVARWQDVSRQLFATQAQGQEALASLLGRNWPKG